MRQSVTRKGAVYQLIGGSIVGGRGRLTDTAYQYVRNGIVHGTFATGSALTETEIAQAIGSSRTPVRNALNQLLREGLVEVGSRRQVIVRGFTDEQRAEILLLREALEGVAVQRACETMALEDIDYLRLLLIRQLRAARTGSNDEFLDYDEEFHLRIVEGARLPILHAFLSQLRGFVRVARLGAPRPASVLAQIVDEHELIVDALERRDARAARRALIEHLHRSDYTIARRKHTRLPSKVER
jgi:DNA-binding GntR family transcriptional regulator